MVTPTEASQSAESGLLLRLAAQPAHFRQAARGSEPAKPLLVDRLDEENRFYFLVPFIRDGETTLVVIVDACSGQFQRTSALRPPGVYLPVDAEAAGGILAARLGAEKVGEASFPRLVWKPQLPDLVCAVSNSPLHRLDGSRSFAGNRKQSLWQSDDDIRLGELNLHTPSEEPVSYVDFEEIVLCLLQEISQGRAVRGGQTSPILDRLAGATHHQARGRHSFGTHGPGFVLHILHLVESVNSVVSRYPVRRFRRSVSDPSVMGRD